MKYTYLMLGLALGFTLALIVEVATLGEGAFTGPCGQITAALGAFFTVQFIAVGAIEIKEDRQ